MEQNNDNDILDNFEEPNELLESDKSEKIPANDPVDDAGWQGPEPEESPLHRVLYILGMYSKQLIIGLLVAILLMTVIMFVVLKRGKDPVVIDNVTVVTTSYPPIEGVDQNIKLILFNNGIGKDAVKIEMQVQDGKAVYKYSVTAQDNTDAVEAEIDRYMQTALFSKSVTYDSVENIIYEIPSYKVSMFFDHHLEPVVIETIPHIDKYPFGVLPPKAGKGKIALLIDDAGASYTLAERIVDINIPLTLAILPHLQYSAETAEFARNKGIGVFLHFPMEPLSYPATDPGEGAALLNMPEILIHEIAKRNVEDLGKIDGFNNHMGSAYTEDTGKMAQILEGVRPYSKVFVDSRTTTKSVAYSQCLAAGFKCGENKKFLDNEKDHAYIAGKLYEAAEFASANGSIIAIGHLRVDTVIVLEQVVPILENLGYEFVLVTSVVGD